MGLINFLLKIIYILLQCTWGIIQSSLGLMVFLYFLKAPHEIYHGAIYTKWNLKGGISLGLFIFTPDKEEIWCQQMAVHEYGHTWQSLMLGPSYLFVVGIPSIIWSKLPKCIQMRKDRNLTYSAFYTEKWADGLGQRMVTLVERIENGFL